MAEEPGDWKGHDPDVLGSLANERVGLAWQRTSLAWAGAGVAIMRYFAESGLRQPRVFAGLAMVLLAGVFWIDGTRRYRSAALAIRENRPTVVPARTLQVVWVSTFLLIGAVAAFEIRY